MTARAGQCGALTRAPIFLLGCVGRGTYGSGSGSPALASISLCILVSSMVRQLVCFATRGEPEGTAVAAASKSLSFVLPGTGLAQRQRIAAWRCACASVPRFSRTQQICCALFISALCSLWLDLPRALCCTTFGQPSASAARGVAASAHAISAACLAQAAVSLAGLAAQLQAQARPATELGVAAAGCSLLLLRPLAALASPATEMCVPRAAMLQWISAPAFLLVACGARAASAPGLAHIAQQTASAAPPHYVLLLSLQALSCYLVPEYIAPLMPLAYSCALTWHIAAAVRLCMSAARQRAQQAAARAPAHAAIPDVLIKLRELLAATWLMHDVHMFAVFGISTAGLWLQLYPGMFAQGMPGAQLAAIGHALQLACAGVVLSWARTVLPGVLYLGQLGKQARERAKGELRRLQLARWISHELRGPMQNLSFALGELSDIVQCVRPQPPHDEAQQSSVRSQVTLALPPCYAHQLLQVADASLQDLVLGMQPVVGGSADASSEMLFSPADGVLADLVPGSPWLGLVLGMSILYPLLRRAHVRCCIHIVVGTSSWCLHGNHPTDLHRLRLPTVPTLLLSTEFVAQAVQLMLLHMLVDAVDAREPPVELVQLALELQPASLSSTLYRHPRHRSHLQAAFTKAVDSLAGPGAQAPGTHTNVGAARLSAKRAHHRATAAWHVQLRASVTRAGSRHTPVRPVQLPCAQQDLQQSWSAWQLGLAQLGGFLQPPHQLGAGTREVVAQVAAVQVPCAVDVMDSVCSAALVINQTAITWRTLRGIGSTSSAVASQHFAYPVHSLASPDAAGQGSTPRSLGSPHACRGRGSLLAAPRMLIADTDSNTRSLIACALARAGWAPEAIVFATTGAAALHIASDAAAEGAPFTALVVDASLPLVSGVQVVRALRGIGLSLHIVGCTSNAEHRAAQDFYAAGADHVLVKPAQAEALLELLSPCSTA